MSKGSEYIAGVFEQVVAQDNAQQSCRQGTFLAAALSVIAEVPSPLKERALVSLAALATREPSQPALRKQRAA